MRVRLFASLLIALIVSACTGTDPISDADTSLSDANISARYISISLAAPSSGSTSRADEAFVWGDDAENAIHKVWFFFFDDQDKTVKVKKVQGAAAGQPALYYEANSLEKNTPTGETNTNIEKIYSATLSLDFENGAIPSQLVAIVNPNPSLNVFNDPAKYPDFSLSDLRDAIHNFRYDITDDTDLATEGNFLMSNSVYAAAVSWDDGNGSDGITESAATRKEICPVAISPDNICTTPGAAAGNSVTIFVERVLARLDISFLPSLASDLKDKIWIQKISCKHFNPETQKETTIEKDIYVKFLGWAVTSTPVASRLIKNVDPYWDDDNFFASTDSWNAPDYFRSYWAVNPSSDELDYQFFSYNDLTGMKSGERKNGCLPIDLEKKTTVYMQENANPFNVSAGGRVTPATPSYPTKVIFAAQVVDEDGEPVSFAEYESRYYTVDGLKVLIANSLDMYREARTDETPVLGSKYVKITPDDLDFETSMQHHGEESPDATDTYYVYFKLKGNGGGSTATPTVWYHKFNSEDEKDAFRIDNPGQYLSDMTFPAKVWNQGYSYYYFLIPHCQSVDKETPGHFGVVRNSLYDATIKEITSLGTPVYDPSEMIYPETQEPTDNQLKVTVKTMKWRMINQNLQLAW